MSIMRDLGTEFVAVALALGLLSTSASARPQAGLQAIPDSERESIYHTPSGVAEGEAFVDELFAYAFLQAVGVTFDSSERMWVWERGGLVWYVHSNGTKAPQPMIDISEEVGSWGGGNGMLGFALDPAFETNGYLYLFYVVDYHHLVHYGLPSYDPEADEYFVDTIARITRYQVFDPSLPGHQIVADPGSRTVLVGDDPQAIFPVCNSTHSVGTLMFGEDHSLLASFGEGYLTTGGSGTCFSDGFLTEAENVNNFRSQLVDTLAGKVIRFHPETGAGFPNNPFYDPLAPKASRSLVWELGVRQPFRFFVRPGTGTPAHPGTLYIGDVGANKWEELNVARVGGLNFGWPIYEGVGVHNTFSSTLTANLHAPNPLFGQDIPGVGVCEHEFFDFQDLLAEDTLGPLDLPNPCDPSVQVPVEFQFEHTRPILTWGHIDPVTLTPTFEGGVASSAQLGEPGAPVQGESFAGESATGGVWYTGTDFPPAFRNAYFMGDHAGGWIKCVRLDDDDRPIEVLSFSEEHSSPVAFATHPSEGGLYYIRYYDSVGATVRRIRFASDLPPVSVASVDAEHGASPFTVQFSSEASIDPEGGALTYAWDFGDQSPFSTEPDPTHTYTASGDGPEFFVARLMVTDETGKSHVSAVGVSVNNTPPVVDILSPLNGQPYSGSGPEAIALSASVADAEHGQSALDCSWEIVLHHGDHTHSEVPKRTCETSAVVGPHHTAGQVEYYEARLTVEDADGLSTTVSHWLPREDDCNLNGSPDAVDIALGSSLDVDEDGVPDECASDCDADGLTDLMTLALGLAPDCDGNGFPDACDIELGRALDLNADGVPDSCQLLSADTPSISLSAGGTQTLTLAAGGDFGGDFYWLFGSLAGVQPGFALGSVVLPLNFPDPYFNLSMLKANQAPFVNSAGYLDGEGTGVMAIALGPNSPAALAGVTLYHAALVADANLLSVLGLEFATNYLTLQLVP